MTDHILYIMVAALLAGLCILQALLAVRQLRKKAPDGPILLTISIVVFVIWVPLCIFEFLYPTVIPLKIAWYVVAVAYMIFAIWYTKNLSKQFPKK